MAKNFFKKEKKKIPTCDPVTGTLCNKEATLSQNSITKRFVLKCDGNFIIDGFFHDCTYKANELGVRWKEQPVLKYVEVKN